MEGGGVVVVMVGGGGAVFELWDSRKNNASRALMLSVCRVFFGLKPLITLSI